MVNTDNEEYKLVKYNKRRQRKPQLKLKADNEFIDDVYSVEEIFLKVNTAKQTIEESSFYQTLLSDLGKVLKILNFNGIAEIVCYGLGNFSENFSSKYQLATLLCIKALYNSDVYIYDPLFTKNEIDCLRKFNLQLIEINEEGRRTLNNQTTLVYMPHCSKQLTNNFLFSNWSPLIHSCILLGNSWSDLECNATNTSLEQTVYCIYKLKPYVTEIELKNIFKYQNTFSGTSFHIFTKEKLNTIAADFWKLKPDCLYFNKDPEFITASDTKGISE